MVLIIIVILLLISILFINISILIGHSNISRDIQKSTTITNNLRSELKCDIPPTTLDCVINDKTQFWKLNGNITYNNIKYKILSFLIFQFNGSPMRSLILTGYIDTTDKYITILTTESAPGYPPIYGSVLITDTPWTPIVQAKPIGGGVMHNTINPTVNLTTFNDVKLDNNYYIVVNNQSVSFNLSI